MTQLESPQYEKQTDRQHDGHTKKHYSAMVMEAAIDVAPVNASCELSDNEDTQAVLRDRQRYGT
jgi:hypothetical protein